MSEMSREEFLRLQRDAESRLRSMQQRSRAASSLPPSPDFVQLRGRESQPQSPQKAPPAQQQKAPSQQRKNGLDILRMLDLKNITMDSDRVLILAVLLLLSSESEDRLLLLALVYIML